jgi:predicted house-cleaning noncanonical NTP pyrophosphatase (MazG superfamily)
MKNSAVSASRSQWARSCGIHSNSDQLSSRPPDLSPDHQLSTANTPLLSIPVDRIVPLPLHLLLGIGNRVLKILLSNIPESDKSISSIKTCHTRGCTGKSDYFDLNGAEIAKFFDKYIPDNILQKFINKPLVITTRRQNDNNMEVKKLLKSFKWVRELKNYLLSKDKFEAEEIADFIDLINEIISEWSSVTGDTLFPKLHMLRHAGEFMKKWKMLGSVSESKLESAHFTVNKLFHTNYSNLGNDTNARLLCTLQHFVYDVCRSLTHKLAK